MSAFEDIKTHAASDVIPEKKETPDACQQTQGLSTTVQGDYTEKKTDSQASNGQLPDSASHHGVQATPPDPLAALAQEERHYPEDLIPWDQSVDIEHVADEMYALIKRHCIMSDDEATAIVLWIISSYMINKFRIFAKLSLISPQKRCGKSTALEIIDALVKEGLISSNVSPASIYRITEMLQITLLFDEADTYIKDGDPQLTGLINSSHSQSTAKIIRCAGDDHKPKTFSTWMPIVLASIGNLPPTIMDRSIVISLRRKKPTESVQKLPTALFSQCRPIRQKILRWCLDSHDRVSTQVLEPPPIGNDRAADNWLPLFRAASQISPTWLHKCECAYRALTQAEEQDLPSLLLTDIQTYLATCSRTQVTSQELVGALLADENGPWATCHNGRKISPSTVATLLKPFGIQPKSIRFGDKVLRGYEKDQFIDAFERYLN